MGEAAAEVEASRVVASLEIQLRLPRHVGVLASDGFHTDSLRAQ